MKNSKENGVLNYIRVLLSISIVLSIFNPVLVASASSEIGLSISSDKVIQGDIANVVISLANCENVTGVNMTLVYQESIVSLSNITKNDSVIAGHYVNYDDLGSGEVNINVTGLSSITTETPIVNVTMLGVTNGTSSINLENVEFVTTDSSSPSGAASNGEINVNTAPVLPEIGDQTINETETLDLSLYTSDADNDDLVYSISNKPDNATFDKSTGEFSWTPVVGETGDFPVNFTVSDGYEEDSENITITVNVKPTPVPGNSAPVFDIIDDINTTAGSLVNFTISANDADDDPLTYYNNSILPDGADFYPGNQTFVWVPSDNGTYNVDFGVSDGNATASLNVRITVGDVIVAGNNAPVLKHIGDLSINESELLEITLNATDADGDSLAFTIANKPANATFDNSTGNFSWTPIDGEKGTYDVIFGVTDGEDDDTEDVTITVNEAGSVEVVEYAPANPVNFINTTGNFWVLHDWDAGTGNVTNGYNVSCDGTWYNITDSEFNDSINLNAHEWSNITVYAYNASSSTLSSGIEDNVQIPNNPISITNVSSYYEINEGDTLYIDVNYTDLDDDSPTFTSNNTTIFDIDASGMASWTPLSSDNGTHYVVLTVSDGYGSEDSRLVEITVGKVNTAPEFAVIGTQSVYKGQELAFNVNATDADDDTLTYKAEVLPSGAEFNSSSGNFTWIPDYEGEYTANFSVTDDEHFVYQEVGITVNTNRAPEFPPFEEITVAENSTMILDVEATDQDDDTLHYTCNATFGTLDNHTFTWTPTYAAANKTANGVYEINFTVSDGELTDNTVITVNVTDVNVAPVLDTIGSQSVDEGEELTINLTATDVDGDDLTFTIDDETKPENATFTSGNFSWTPIDGEAGTYYVLFGVNDSEDTVTENVTITVTSGSSSSSSSSSSGSGGGGGGGSLSSGEKYENILLKDYVLKSVVKDTETVFSFSKENNSIVSVSFTSKLNGGQVKAVIEMLYDTSSQVESDAPGIVYKNMNIGVDTKLSSDAIGNSKINFKVEKEWLDENEIDISTITLCRYSGGWGELPTEVQGEDEDYYYFIATTPGFSPFAISSVDPTLEVVEEPSAELTEGNPQDAESMMSTEDMTQMELTTEPPQEKGKSSIVPVIVLMGLIALTIVGIFGYRNKDYYDKLRMQLGNPDGKRYRRVRK
jgi:PGF-pre-PGF domain-containing protein